MGLPTLALAGGKVLASDLRAIETFADLPEDGLHWMAGCMVMIRLAKGQVFSREGEIRGQAEDGGQRVLVVRAGQITGMLPYSRLATLPLTTRAVEDSRIALLHKDHFPDMLYRIREVTKLDVQREKILALGRLSAGLAHELNNPAAAAKRASVGLRQAFHALRMANIRLDERTLTAGQRALLAGVEREERLAEHR